MGTLFPVFNVSERDRGDAGRRCALVVGVVAAGRAGVAGGAGDDRRRAARGRLSAASRSPWPSRSPTSSATSGRAPAHHGAHRGRHGARRVRVRAVLMLDAGLEQTLVATGQYDNVLVIRRAAQHRDAERRRPRSRRRSSRRCRTSRVGADGAPLVSQGDGGADQRCPSAAAAKPANVVDPRRRAGRASRCGRRCGSSTGGMFRPGTLGDRRRARASPSGFDGARHRRDAALRRRATGPSSASSTPARSGFDSEIWGDAEQMLQAFRRSAFSSVIVAPRRSRRASTRSSASSRPTRGSRSRSSARRASTTTSRRRCRTSSATSA